MHFESPFVLTMICTSLFSLYLPWTLLCARLGWGENPPWRDPPTAEEGRQHILYTTVHHDSTAARRIDELPLRTSMDGGDGAAVPASDTPTVADAPPVPRWSHVRTLRLALVVYPLFFIANFSYNVSLAHTSVTSNTIISTTASLWTFLFSTCRGLERFAWVKMLGLLLSIGGTVMVGLGDQNSGTDTVAGDALCLFAAVMYGVYTTALRILVPDDTCVSFQLLFGYVGLLALSTLLPLTLIFTQVIPSMFEGFTFAVFGFIVVNGLCDNVLSDYLWARSIVLTSPTVATVGLSLTIPLAFLSDAAMGKLHGGMWEILGAVTVAGGFVLVSYNQKGQVEDEEAEEARKAAAVLAAGGLGDGHGQMGLVGDEEDEEEDVEVEVGGP